jgi:hypothetical protein
MSPAVDRLFKKLATDDFETILQKVADARDVVAAVTDDQIVISAAISAEIRKNLVEAVSEIHSNVPDESAINCIALNNILKRYGQIFTTNYDLILYWCRKNINHFTIIDYFFDGHKFDRTEIDRRDRSAMYFLHGAIFLFESDAETWKLNVGSNTTLLDAVKEKLSDEGVYPVFISEGSSDEKLQAIKRNEYLSFCYDSLRQLDDELEIYGHALSLSVDGHIVDAIKESEIKSI